MSWAGEASDYQIWFPNSYRFETEKEAAAFIKELQAQWIPKNFILTTRTVKSRDPVNARWNGRDAVRLNVAFEPAPILPAAVTDDDDGEESIAPLVNERVYRGNARKRKVLRRIFNRETYRRFKDETRWHDEEGRVLQSEVLRHDLRQMIFHQDCRLELTRRLYNDFKLAHGGRAPGESYIVKHRADHGSCRFGIDESVRQLKEEYGDDEPHYETSERLITKSAKRRGVTLQSLKTKSLAKLVALAEELGVEGAGQMRKSELLHNIIKESENIEEPYFFGLDEPAGTSAMQDLVRWLVAPEVYARYKLELAALRDQEAAEPRPAARPSPILRLLEARKANNR